MANPDLQFVNAALVVTGNEPITAFDDATTAGKIMAARYEVMIAQELGSHRWKWCTKDIALNLLTDTPQLPWLYAFQMPDPILLLRTVSVAGIPIPYELMSDKILCNEDNSIPVIAKYTWRPDEANWPPYFSSYFTALLESVFLRGVKQKDAEADAREKVARGLLLSQAKRLDAQSQPSRNPESSPTLEARRGRIPPRLSNR